MKRQELQIRLNPAQLANLSKGGRLVIDVDDPAPAEVTTAQICEATGQTVRVIPTTKKNNFRTSGTCCDCIGYNRRRGANVFRCTKKTFKGDCYAMAALSHVCDKFEPKNGGRK
jgi:hypothetical protein